MSIRKAALFGSFVCLFLTAAVVGVAQRGVVRVPRADDQPGAACAQGFVWREAFAGDYACVTSQSRSVVANENTDPAHAEPCQTGTVWREARPSDHICVSLARRSAVAEENRQASTHIAGGPPPAPAPAPPPPPAGPQVLITSDPYWDWRADAIQFTTNVPSTGIVQYGTGSPIETPGGWNVRGATATASFNAPGTVHKVSLPMNALPKAKIYYYVITIRANGTTDQSMGSSSPPVSIDGR